PLLATDFIEASSLLLVNFPARFQYIFSSLAGMLLLSICFTFVIVAAFAYSLHLIFKQKKISEITNDFINNMTHELKTPLATISMTADTLLLAGVSSQPDMVNEYSGMIKGEVKKLSRHVDRILESAVTESNNNEHQGYEKINLNELVRDEVKLFDPLVIQHGGTIEAVVPAENIFVYAGKDMLRGVICNLLDNALKYSEEAPQIKITLQQKQQSAVLCVADSGIGIGKADQKHVFEKFYRAHTGNRHDVKGFGLGLSFAKSVIEGAGGKIWVESTLAEGSRFFIELPTA
ncbi:MAG TPA: HAMP domain-containing sensor histidine kinase, partial [Chitinophagales bacterium]|nr:HAMP domain-containing sensor histidine kinase [Chitinophagales bacterium]